MLNRQKDTIGLHCKNIQIYPLHHSLLMTGSLKIANRKDLKKNTIAKLTELTQQQGIYRSYLKKYRNVEEIAKQLPSRANFYQKRTCIFNSKNKLVHSIKETLNSRSLSDNTKF